MDDLERTSRVLLEAFNRRDLEEALALLDPEVTLRSVTALGCGDGHPYRGHEGIRRYAEDIEEHWLDLTVEPAQFRAAGEAITALGVVRGQGRRSGVVLRDVPASWLMRFRGGLVREVWVFSDAQALEGVLAGVLLRSTPAAVDAGPEARADGSGQLAADGLAGAADGLVGTADGLVGAGDGLAGEADGLAGEADGLVAAAD